MSDTRTESTVSKFVHLVVEASQHITILELYDLDSNEAESVREFDELEKEALDQLEILRKFMVDNADAIRKELPQAFKPVTP